jgi:hypothetical protein
MESPGRSYYTHNILHNNTSIHNGFNGPGTVNPDGVNIDPNSYGYFTENCVYNMPSYSAQYIQVCDPPQCNYIFPHYIYIFNFTAEDCSNGIGIHGGYDIYITLLLKIQEPLFKWV